jgi:transporter family protein
VHLQRSRIGRCDARSSHSMRQVAGPVTATFTTKWFLYSVLCIVSWSGWTLFGKVASREIPATTLQFLFPFGCLPVMLPLLASRHFRLERCWKGIGCGIANGVLAGIGSLALFAAYQTGGNTSIITAATAMYPLISVVLAVSLLRERLTRLQALGLVFAAAAFVIFSM